MLPILSTNESRRLEALASYAVLDTIPEDDYEAITQIAAYICQTPVSLITLLDDQRQWFKSVHGLSIRQTPREFAFCHHAIQNPTQLMEVSDAHLDERFATNPLVTGEPNIVFYAGVPLLDAEGYALGTLCVIDHKIRQLSPQQATVLKALARQVVTQLGLRRSQAQLRKAEQTLQLLNDKLRQSNHVLSTVVDTCPVGLELWRAVREGQTIIDFEYVFTNPVHAVLEGLPSNQLIGHSLKKRFPDATSIFDRLVRVVQTNQPQRYQEQRARLDQNVVWHDVTLTPCGDGVLCTAQDITPLKETEQQLRSYSRNLNQLVAERTAEIYQLSALQQAILHHAGMAIVSTDVDGLIQTVNPAALALLGYPIQELIGNKYPTLLPCPPESPSHTPSLADHLAKSVWADSDEFKLLADGQTHECVVLTKNGRRIPVLLVLTALHDEAGALTGYVSMATDITPQKEMELVLQQTLQREQALSKLKSQFVSTASHEFRTPLTTIQSSVELVKLHLERASMEAQPAIERHLGIIEKQIVNFSRLLSDILSIGRIDAGRINYNPQPVDVVSLASEVISTHYSDWPGGRSVQLLITGQPRLACLDAQLIAHVLVNLLSNAFKFSVCNPDLHITFEQDQLVIRVTDTGIGIPAAELTDLFSSFFRASNAAAVPGSGLGLVIARQFALLHGGQLAIASEEHMGTTGTLTLPT